MTATPNQNPWQPVVWAGDLPDCSCCDEPWCSQHDAHYGDCACLGPSMDEDEYEYKTIDGVDYCRARDPQPEGARMLTPDEYCAKFHNIARYFPNVTESGGRASPSGLYLFERSVIRDRDGIPLAHWMASIGLAETSDVEMSLRHSTDNFWCAIRADRKP